MRLALPSCREWRRGRPSLHNSHDEVRSLVDDDTGLSRSSISRMDMSRQKHLCVGIPTEVGTGCRKAALRLAQLFLKLFDLLSPFGIVFTLRTVGNADVGCDFVCDKAAGGRVRNTCKVIKSIVLGQLLFLFEQGLLVFDFDQALKGLLKPSLGLRLPTRSGFTPSMI